MPEEKRSIRILQKKTNLKGDLFTKMVEDYFLALGYENFRLNVHKPGREIDLSGSHRTESRDFRAECKATTDPIGGDQVNKFFGSLDAERRTFPGRDITGYFLSTGGFTETALEQERAAGNRIILVNAERIINELVKGRIIVSETRAVELAVSCGDGSPRLRIFDPPELLLHTLGWIWLVFLGTQKQKSHFALVHGDGEALSLDLANAVVKADMKCGGNLHELSLMNVKIETLPDVQSAKTAYLKFLEKECGEIQLDGLPADQDIGTRRLRLETIFVPMHLTPAAAQSGDETELGIQSATTTSRKGKARTAEGSRPQRYSVGLILRKYNRIAILGLPGGGKSTLVKRIATAYARPERRGQVPDALPDREWLPIFIRCRQLQNLVRLPITEIIEGLSHHAELGDLEKSFCQMVARSLHEGSALLLVDGLDEISEDGDRTAFVNQLRIFLARYPGVALVLTSREAGFRIVSGAVGGICTAFQLAEFRDADIERLTVSWHKEVVGSKAAVIEDAKQLALTICDTDRVRRLATNPLLLTTLLLVKRWVGQLPTRRTVLYGKAIEVLLMTWNVEGHEPLDIEEVLPQLEFVAFAMMADGLQRLSSKHLKELLIAARAQMPEILGFAKISVGDFVDRVELRSSILMLSGHGIEDGNLYPMYEFRHLTFQEYLAAKAIVEGYYPGRKEADSILSVLEPHFDNESWREVIPLVAVLAGRRAQPLIERLISIVKTLPPNPEEEIGFSKTNPADLLLQCFADEVQASPHLTREALKWGTKRSTWFPEVDLQFREGKYASIYDALCREEFTTSEEDFFVWGGVIGRNAHETRIFKSGLSDVVEEALNLLSSSDAFLRAKAFLILMEKAFSLHSQQPIAAEDASALKRCVPYIVSAMNDGQIFVQFSALWAHVWFCEALRDVHLTTGPMWEKLLQIWEIAKVEEVRFLAAWNLQMFPVGPRDSSPFRASAHLIKFARETIAATALPGYRRYHRANQVVAAIVAFYHSSVADDETIGSIIGSHIQPKSTDLSNNNLIEYLNSLDDVGHQYLEKLKNHDETSQ